MANQYIIRPAQRQNFEAFVRYVVGLAEGARVETDTSGKPYFVRVDEATYRRWVDALPKKAAPEALPEPESAPDQQPAQQDAGGDASASADEAKAPAEPEALASAETPAAAAAPEGDAQPEGKAQPEPEAEKAVPEPEAAPPKQVAKRAKGRTAGASRKRSTGGSN